MENKREEYVAPEVIVIECQVEKGFATSSEEPFGFGDPVETGSTKDWWFK